MAIAFLGYFPPGVAVHAQLEKVEHVLEASLPVPPGIEREERVVHSQRIYNVWNFKKSGKIRSPFIRSQVNWDLRKLCK